MLLFTRARASTESRATNTLPSKDRPRQQGLLLKYDRALPSTLLLCEKLHSRAPQGCRRSCFSVACGGNFGVTERAVLRHS